MRQILAIQEPANGVRGTRHIISGALLWALKASPLRAYNKDLSIEELREELVNLAEQAQGIQYNADAEGRGLTASEQSELDTIFSNYDVRKEELDRKQGLAARVGSLSAGTGRKTQPPQPGGGIPPGLRSGGPQGGGGRVLFRNEATGEIVRALGREERLAPNAEPGILGEVVSAYLRNDLGSLRPELRNAVTGTSGSSGGFMLPSQLSSMTIDLARAASVCLRAGAQSIPLAAREVGLLKLEADPSVYWRGEGVAVTGSKPVFGLHVLMPKTVAAIVPVTVEMLEDAPNAPLIIEAALQAALGLAIDQACLAGNGVGRPLGIIGESGVNTQTGIGTPTDYVEITKAVGDIYTANFPGDPSELSWILSPTQAATYDGLVTGISGDKTPLRPTPWAAALQKFLTTSLSGQMIVGDFRELLMGFRTDGVVIDILDSGSVVDDDGQTINAASQFFRLIRCRVRVDSLAMRPGWFSTMTI